MSCSIGEKRAVDIYMGRHGTSFAAPTCFPQSSVTFHGKTAALESDKLIRRQNIVIMAFHYSKTASHSYKTNKVRLKDIISHITHVWPKFKASLFLAEYDWGISGAKGNA